MLLGFSHCEGSGRLRWCPRHSLSPQSVHHGLGPIRVPSVPLSLQAHWGGQLSCSRWKQTSDTESGHTASLHRHSTSNLVHLQKYFVKAACADGKQLLCIWRPDLNCFPGAGHSVQSLVQNNSAENTVSHQKAISW